MIVPFSRGVPQRVREASDVAGDVAVPARRHQSHVQQVVDPAGVPGWAGEASYQFLEVGSVVADALLALGRDSLDELPDGVVYRRLRTVRRRFCRRPARRREPLGSPVGHFLHHPTPPTPTYHTRPTTPLAITHHQ